MARANDEYRSLRFGPRESSRVVVALLVSLLLHIVAAGIFLMGNELGWWKVAQPPIRLQAAAKRNPLTGQIVMAQQQQQEPDTYVDVSHADSDAPSITKASDVPNTRFYAVRNSRAANPEPGKLSTPKVNGTQTDAPKTEDTPRAERKPEAAPKTAATETLPEIPKNQNTPPPQLEPVMPAPAPLSLPVPQPQQPAGDTDLKPKPETTLKARPRTLKQALSQRDQLPGTKMAQDGGVPRRADFSLDAKATPFAEYDRDLIDAIVQRWFDFLDKHDWSHPGQVVVVFKLKSDGTVIEIRTLENTMGDMQGYLCQESIEEASPFAKWPSDMMRELGANSREYAFTFNYY